LGWGASGWGVSAGRDSGKVADCGARACSPNFGNCVGCTGAEIGGAFASLLGAADGVA
jgi:hypothetical protein